MVDGGTGWITREAVRSCRSARSVSTSCRTRRRGRWPRASRRPGRRRARRRAGRRAPCRRDRWRRRRGRTIGVRRIGERDRCRRGGDRRDRELVGAHDLVLLGAALGAQPAVAAVAARDDDLRIGARQAVEVAVRCADRLLGDERRLQLIGIEIAELDIDAAERALVDRDDGLHDLRAVGVRDGDVQRRIVAARGERDDEQDPPHRVNLIIHLGYPRCVAFDRRTLIQTGLATPSTRGRTAARSYSVQVLGQDGAGRRARRAADHRRCARDVRPRAGRSAGVSPTCRARDHARRASAIKDLGSTNGTWYQGTRVTEVVVPAGATIKFGGTPVRIAAADTPSLPPSDDDHFGQMAGQERRDARAVRGARDGGAERRDRADRGRVGHRQGARGAARSTTRRRARRGRSSSSIAARSPRT